MKILGKGLLPEGVDTSYKHGYVLEVSKEELDLIMLQMLFRADSGDDDDLDPSYKLYLELKEQLKAYE